MKVTRCITERKIAANRMFYDNLFRELVCEIYEKNYTGINANLVLSSFYRYANNETHFKKINEVLSEKAIKECNSVISEIRQNPPKNIVELKKELLKRFPAITDCGLDGINQMMCIPGNNIY